jgi:hypothetical protein
MDCGFRTQRLRGRICNALNVFELRLRRERAHELTFANLKKQKERERDSSYHRARGRPSLASLRERDTAAAVSAVYSVLHCPRANSRRTAI